MSQQSGGEVSAGKNPRKRLRHETGKGEQPGITVENNLASSSSSSSIVSSSTSSSSSSSSSTVASSSSSSSSSSTVASSYYSSSSSPVAPSSSSFGDLETDEESEDSDDEDLADNPEKNRIKYTQLKQLLLDPSATSDILDEQKKFEFDEIVSMVSVLRECFCPRHSELSEYLQRNELMFGRDSEVRARFDKYSQVVRDVRRAIEDMQRQNQRFKESKRSCVRYLQAAADGPDSGEEEEGGGGGKRSRHAEPAGQSSAGNSMPESLFSPEEEVEMERCSQDLKNIADNICAGFMAVVQLQRQYYRNDPQTLAALPTLETDSYFQEVDEEKELRDHQRLILYYLEVCRREGYRKVGTWLYRPRFTEARPEDVLAAAAVPGDTLLERGLSRQHQRQPKRYFTHSYVRYKEIETFMYDEIYPYQQHKKLFMELTGKYSTPGLVMNHLQKCKAAYLPWLEKSRNHFSFRNGVFCACEKEVVEVDVECVDSVGLSYLKRERVERYASKFYTYEETPGFDTTAKLGADVVAIQYFDVEFDAENFKAILESEEGPLGIDTPETDKIFKSQGFDIPGESNGYHGETMMWGYAAVGRLLFEVGELDNWQFFPFFKGTAGSGKSSLLKLAAALYPAEDVGNLQSAGSETFALETIYDKKVFFGMDVDNKMKFPKSTFLSIVTGESVTINIKNKRQFDVERWIAPGAFAGNTYPPWIDEGGNLARRYLLFLFDRVPEKSDPMLEKKCKLEVAAFLQKSVACYLHLVNKFGHRDIWSKGVLPRFFHDNAKRMLEETDPFTAFLNSDSVSLGEDLKVSKDNLMAKYRQFCKENGLTHKRFSKEDMSNTMIKFGIKYHHLRNDGNYDPAEHDGFKRSYFTGIELNLRD